MLWEQYLQLCIWRLGGCLVFVFPSPITQKWWDPRRESLFGFVFKFCFHHLILWFLSNELWKLKTLFRCFQVMKTELWWQSCKYTHIEGPTNCNFWLHSSLFFSFFNFFFSVLLHVSFFLSLFFPCSSLQALVLSFFLYFLPLHLSHLRPIIKKKKKKETNFSFSILRCKH